jgi:opacity protein-like surface antigen
MRHRQFPDFPKIKHQLFPVLFLLLAMTFLAPAAKAQRNELGIFFGGSYYLGDLNPHRQFAMTRIAGGGIYRFNINPHVALRLNGILASVEGNDAVVKYNEDRNLSFVSNIAELSIQGEVNFLHFVSGNLDTPHTPYIFAGAGMFSFNPKAEYGGRWYELQPLGTEGQGTEAYPDREPYKRYSSSFLFGLGYKFNITRHITGGLEWGMRRTGTDYLDDVSTTYPDPSVLSEMGAIFSDRSLEHQGQNAGFQRGNPNNNDWYSFAGFILTFRILSSRRADCPAFN